SLYNNDIAANETHDEAERVKNKTNDWLYARISDRILSYLGDTQTRAILYQVASKGGGRNRATATCTRCDSTVEVEMADRFNKTGSGVAVVLIDMQADLEKSDIGQNKHYGGKTGLDHQQEVLEIAAALRSAV